MKHNRLRRATLVALAMIFLALAWVWDGLAAVARFFIGLIRWTRFKAAFVALIDRLPAPLVLLVFLVPFLIVEPLLVAATVAVAMGYVVSGAITWIVLKLLAIGLIPAIFDVTQHRLMTMPWFVRVYEKVMEFHHYADRLVAPYKEAAAALVRQWRTKAAAILGRDRGVAQRAVRFVSRKRAGNGRPPVATNS
jgi:hypothetical protein